MAVELTGQTTTVRQPATHTEDTPAKKTSNAFKDNLAAIFGIIVLVAYAGFIFYMLTLTSLPDTSWNRAVYLLGGTEAIAFAAAGALFGNTVQRQQTKDLKDEAKQAKQDQARAEQEKNNQKMENARQDEGVAIMSRAFARTKTEENKAPEQAMQELQALFEDAFPKHAK
jgi:hypothetical protein